MDVVIRTAHGEAEVTVAHHGPDVTIGDVVERTTGRPPPTVVFVDGRAVPLETPLGVAGLLNGAVVGLDHVDHVWPGEPVAPGADGAVELVTVAGTASGRTCRLVPGRYHIGPGRAVGVDELSAGTVHDVRLTISVAAGGGVSLEATSGRLEGAPIEGPTPWRFGRLALDDRALSLRPGDGASAPRRPIALGIDGSAAFNRPPRPAPESLPPPLDVPEGGAAARDRRQFPLLAMLAPIPIAVGMALVIGNPRYMLFGLLSPVMMLASWTEERRSARRERRQSAHADTAALGAFREAAAAQFTDDVARARRAHPAISDLITRALTTDPALWERRSEHDDAFVIPIGAADMPWAPPLDRHTGSIDEAPDIVDQLGPLPCVPVVADLLDERGLGIVGPGPPARALARGVVLAATTLHGPADLDVLVCAGAEHIGEWEWVKWLPHARPRGGPQLLSSPDAVTSWAAAVAGAHVRPSRPTRPGHMTLVVADGAAWWRDRTAPLRAVLADPTMPVRIVALTDDVHTLPAVCTTFATLDAGGTARVDDVLRRSHIGGVLPNAVDADLALAVARALAPLDDPEVPTTGRAALPERVPILDVVGIDEPTVERVLARWTATGKGVAAPTATVGVAASGAFTLDLVADGPHGLIAGTTGSGKSELLRSLVVGLAATLPPDELNVVLVDFKGGSAFDACAHLPHTVGLVTDLDEHLAGRVLRCLRAELGHRERVLRDAGVTSLDEHRQLPTRPPLPRLLIVVDEFALLAMEFPEFMPALVDIAQRGRSLGLHLILATQRPAGVVDNKIKANTNLRIALRVQDDGDSIDIIGTRDAVAIPRRIPGRAIARLGAGELVEFQSALATSTRGRRETGDLDLRPYVVARELTPMEAALGAAEPQHRRTAPAASTDLSMLVAAMSEAASALGQSEQRRPYPEPLPEHLPLERLLADHPGDAVPFARTDLPDQQRTGVRWWQPGPDGSMIVYGVAGSGTSSLLATLAIGVSRRFSADDVHLYVIDADTNLLAPLDGLPHTGAVVGLDDAERLARVVRHVAREVERRRRLAVELGGPARVVRIEPAVAVLVDNIGALRQYLDDRRDLADVWPSLEMAIRDGRSLGICAVLAASHERAIPSTTAGLIPERLAMRLADRMAYTGFGLRAADVPRFVPGRALCLVDHTELQVAAPPADLAAAVAEIRERAVHRPPVRIDPMPGEVPLSRLLSHARRDGATLRLPVGIDLRHADAAVLRLELGSSAFVIGPSRSGRSTVLAAIATALHCADPTVTVHAVAPRGGPLDAVATVAARASTPPEVAAWVEDILAARGPRVVLVDDADRLAGPSFERLAAVDDDVVSFVVAGRPDGLRSVSHWSRPLQQTQTGVLLRPGPLDGEFLRVQLGARVPRFDTGRGFLVNDGDLAPIMIATPGR